MQRSLMAGLNEKDMQAVVNTYDLKPYYFPTLFPLAETLFLTWKTLEAQGGLKIAADIVSRDATIPKKTREAVSRISGDIPKLAVSREKREDELTEYNMMLLKAGNNADLKAIVEFWAEDTKFCWEAIAARAEWLALKQISLGKVKLTQTNNTSVITEVDVDYQVPGKQKLGVVSKWTDPGAKPVTKDFKNAVAVLRKAGYNPKFVFMNLTTFASFVEQEEVIKMSASFANNTLGISLTPDLAAVNAMLVRQPWLYGLQVVLVDQDITLEGRDGKRETGNPFEDNVALFSESKVLGKTYWKKPIDMDLQASTSIKVMNGPTLIKKYSTESPISEITEGIANMFPVWMGANRSLLLQTDDTSWRK